MAFRSTHLTRNPLSVCVGLLSLSLLLASCHTEDYRNTIAEKSAIAEQTVEQAKVPAAPHRYNPLTVTDSIWNGGKAVRMRHGMPLPGRVEGDKSVALISSTAMSLRSIANAIAAQTGIQTRLDKDADEAGGDEDDAGSSAAPVASAATPPGAPKPPSAPVKKMGGANSPGLRLAYEGPLSGLLDRAASHFGVTWKYDGGAIVFSKFETRVFVMNALPGTQKVTDGLKDDNSSNNASASGNAQVTTVSQSAASQSSSLDIDFKFWDEIGKTIEVILGGVGSYSLAPSSGTVTVMTTPAVMHQISDYLNQENDRLGKQVAINVEIYTIDLNEGEDFNTKFDTALRRLTNLGINFTSPSAPAAATTGTLGSLSLAVLNPETVGQVTDMFSLLSSVGKTARVAQFPMTTLNNRPVSRRVGQDRTYLASVQTNTSQTFQNTTLTPGIIRDGFSIQVTPRILQDGNIILQYSLSLVDLLEISKFTSVPTDASGLPIAGASSQGASQIQLPRTATRVFVQQSMLRSGSTLVLAGYDQDQMTQNSSGIGDAYNYALGGGVGNSRVRQVLFIAMTPQEISLPRTENE